MANIIIAGDYLNKKVIISKKGVPFISDGFYDVKLTPEHLASYSIIDLNTRKSASSAITRATVGAAFLGPVGLAAGISAKNKSTYHIELVFKDGKRSLLEANDQLYQLIVSKNF